MTRWPESIMLDVRVGEWWVPSSRCSPSLPVPSLSMGQLAGIQCSGDQHALEKGQ